MPTAALQRKAYQGTLLLLLFTGLATLGSYALRVLYARSFSPAEYGMFYAVLSLMLIIGLLRNAGLSEAVTFFSARKRAASAVVSFSLRFQLVLGCMLAILLWLLAAPLAAFYLHDASARMLLIIFGLAYVVVGPGEIFVAHFRGLQRYVLFGGAELFRIALILLFTLVFINSFSLEKAALAWLLAYIVFSILYWFLYGRVRFEVLQPKARKEVMRYALFSLTATAGLLVFYNVDTLLITLLRGTYETGLYNAALPLANVLLILSLPFSLMLFPVVSALRTKAKLNTFLTSVYLYASIAAAGVGGLLLLFGRELLVLLFGSAYAPAYAAFLILLFAALIRTFVELQFSVLAGLGAVKDRARLLSYALLLNTVLNVFFILWLGMIGAAVATLISFLVLLVATAVRLRSSGIAFPLWQPSRVLLASIPFFAAVYWLSGFLPELSLLPLVLVCGCILALFGGWLLLWRIVRIRSLHELLSFIKK